MTPRKRFGQHFLSDQNVIHRIVDALHPTEQQHLVEIGPGQGALTVPVLRQCKHLQAIELDRDLIDELQARTQRLGHLEIFSQDVLQFDFAKLKTDARLLRVFGNLPYNISTPLIFHVLQYQPIISDMLFMLQKEVAERLSATPHTKQYSRLSVMVQYHCAVELLFDVPRTAFYPPPQVTSSIVSLTPHRPYPVIANNLEVFENLVRTAFSMRRKTLRNSLKNLITNDAWQTADINPQLRPEDLTVKQYVTLANLIST